MEDMDGDCGVECAVGEGQSGHICHDHIEGTPGTQGLCCLHGGVFLLETLDHEPRDVDAGDVDALCQER
jgi:hypothetical protein